MHKKLIIAIVVGLILTKATCDSQQTNATLETEIPAKERNAFKALLDALVVSQPEGTWNDSDREVLSEHRKKQQEAIEKLRQLGTNALPLLMEEVRAVGRVEKTNRSAAFKDTQQLGKAFEILGSSASPLVPLLISELQSGRSIGPSMIGLASIGGTDAGLALVPQVTNSDPVVRNWAMSALSSFKTNNNVANDAVPLLLERLDDESAFSRAEAASVLGTFRVNSEKVLPHLLQIAEHDPDIAAKCQAIKAIGKFGTKAAPVRSNLEQIAAAASDSRVKRIASVAIQAIDGQIAPDDLQ